jgi:magnesium-transporting ATPase (P-type)
MNEIPSAFWSVQVFKLLKQFRTTPQGLAGEDARQRLAQFGANLLKPKKRSDTLSLLLAQFKSPIIILLPFTPVGALFGFVRLPALFIAVMGAVVTLYIPAAEAVKRIFYRKVRF